MENGNRVVFCHVDLIQYPEAAVLGALVNASLAQLYLVIPESVRPDQLRAAGVHMKRYIICGPSEYIRQILRQNILACRLGACQQKILPLQQA